uniref:Uncharacterized protein n=1 Tax=Candidatus Kentrum sp. DK TaxID=2126562 RepID=A0A450T0G0_9GAMM|nr:MAG: hypothetical protein BECKDK2373C_GA0170839_107320 [Candidatus Kentron sp. DK]
MARDSSRTTDNTSLPNAYAASDSHTPRDSCVFPNKHVMSNLNLIIDLYTIFKDSILQRTSVNCGIGTNFYIITNLNRTQLRYFYPNAIIICNTKTITPNYGSRMNQGMFSDDNILANRYIGLKLRIITNSNVFS